MKSPDQMPKRTKIFDEPLKDSAQKRQAAQKSEQDRPLYQMPFQHLSDMLKFEEQKKKENGNV